MVLAVFALMLSVIRKQYISKVLETVHLLQARPLLVLSEERLQSVVYQNLVILKNTEKSSCVEIAL